MAAKLQPDCSEETLLWNSSQGGVFVFGVDEAGRGCLAGPVCAAVSCWSPFTAALPVPVRDSKLMKEAERESCFAPIQDQALSFGVGFSSCTEIDRFNILRANHLAVARALEQALGKIAVADPVCAFLSDGNQPLVAKAREFLNHPEYKAHFPRLAKLFARGFTEKCIVKGDSKVFSIAAASVLAKVSRDRHMHTLHASYPTYEFAAHKGYSTPRHVELLRAHGPCPEHRMSFAPVAESRGLFT